MIFKWIIYFSFDESNSSQIQKFSLGQDYLINLFSSFQIKRRKVFKRATWLPISNQNRQQNPAVLVSQIFICLYKAQLSCAPFLRCNLYVLNFIQQYICVLQFATIFDIFRYQLELYTYDKYSLSLWSYVSIALSLSKDGINMNARWTNNN